ncbi:bifunctional 2-C-methyl-D-erythritol 4-phosphate cytidylyltransferase/2-C-methyl-D-erythritol 2,4-cyclodiphosphate synthase [Ketogulonicigenium vulgare]|uniref:Bifunctional enzyme IspD/IspF n=1 Tax=Ketogulonicigenium vulgare (strain WSH-001) TaxID=759362 RepID=F9Y505_KETVW|nr:bifunctional 2-C-methyl-D-erythritol 4-phosphate cytidylyltransferase/2-C-methyl-D-erythritol 2,4-cyclodiphosphate synthase [Ketogulonicigenium vulgare]ADO42438.1 2-C-methyl-D-erythritol 4-phosphate cytidylyltransferase/ 2C-methyl-D-erythritol 2,4-cyclodiphosphate synthase [Ketogulonicigenium vulgare Y25]AEM40637.1 bifunctional 2-C-methyl-D-erythritol 4-phosphate cytidylyltransferase/2-C-methyl-D-erythritol 2,4-cyclodiphosphate synthase protein [Ketogulonicigenium vulgare WSH-001]ALJ80810.1 h
MQIAVVIVAAGRGLRAGGGLPKQWRLLNGQPVLAHTLALFQRDDRIGQIALVTHPDEAQRCGSLPQDKLIHTIGGATRSESVLAGLRALAPHAPSHVLIHDAARPLTPQAVIDGVIAALQTHAGAAPALPVTDALWRGAGDIVTQIVPRDGLLRAQTPQGFAYRAILQAHETAPSDAADDVALALRAGIEVAITPGDERNLKLTTAADFTRAAKQLEDTMDIRTGNGFDVHAFGPGQSVWLCGVEVPHSHGLVGHSDADVGMHAVTDAIYGALAAGDIGQHFPPSDPQWKGAASRIFLDHACAMARDQGFTMTHVDCTLICEQPKIGPHAPAMRAAMAAIMGLEETRVSVKATTSERLGFTGRSEGIAAIATATLVKA